MKTIAFALAALAAASVANAGNQDVYFTEVMYTGLFGELIEVTNTHATDAVDLTDWSFDDNSRVVGTVSLPAASLAAGKSLIITEVSETIFVQAWFTEPSKSRNSALILANNTTNLGRSDELNIWDDNSVLVDRLTYNDQGSGSVAGPRSEDISAKPGTLGNNVFSAWVLSGTAAGGTPNGNAWKAGVPGATGPIGSPGTYPN